MNGGSVLHLTFSRFTAKQVCRYGLAERIPGIEEDVTVADVEVVQRQLTDAWIRMTPWWGKRADRLSWVMLGGTLGFGLYLFRGFVVEKDLHLHPAVIDFGYAAMVALFVFVFMRFLDLVRLPLIFLFASKKTEVENRG